MQRTRKVLAIFGQDLRWRTQGLYKQRLEEQARTGAEESMAYLCNGINGMVLLTLQAPILSIVIYFSRDYQVITILLIPSLNSKPLNP